MATFKDGELWNIYKIYDIPFMNYSITVKYNYTEGPSYKTFIVDDKDILKDMDNCDMWTENNLTVIINIENKLVAIEDSKGSLQFDNGKLKHCIFKLRDKGSNPFAEKSS